MSYCGSTPGWNPYVFRIDLKDKVCGMDLKMVKWDYNQMNKQIKFITKFSVKKVKLRRGRSDTNHAFSYPALISVLINIEVVYVYVLWKENALVACHGQKTPGGCIDFRWSTNFQLILMHICLLVSGCLWKILCYYNSSDKYEKKKWQLVCF